VLVSLLDVEISTWVDLLASADGMEEVDFFVETEGRISELLPVECLLENGR